jgi:hypothetical protein
MNQAVSDTSDTTVVTTPSPVNSLFSLAPKMEAIVHPEEQAAFLSAMQAVNPQFKPTFKRFSSRDFKRLSIHEAEALYMSLMAEASTADVIHLHLDWHSYLGRFPLHEGLKLWLHLLTAFREKPTVLFSNEAPVFLNNALMVLEKSSWLQLCAHFTNTSKHTVVVHDVRIHRAWVAAGFPEENLHFIPRPMPHESTLDAYPAIQPALDHLVKRRLGIDMRDPTPSPTRVIGLLPSDDDIPTTEGLIVALRELSSDHKLLVLGGSSEANPEHAWERTLLGIIANQQLQGRVIITGPVSLTERYTYLNACDALLLSDANDTYMLQSWVYDSVRMETPVLLGEHSTMMTHIREA